MFGLWKNNIDNSIEKFYKNPKKKLNKVEVFWNMFGTFHIQKRCSGRS